MHVQLHAACSAADVLDVRIGTLDLIVEFIIEWKLPHLFPGLFGKLAHPVGQLFVSPDNCGDVGAKRDYGGAGERRKVNYRLGAIGGYAVSKGVGKYHTPFSVSVEYLDCLSVVHLDYVSRAV